MFMYITGAYVWYLGLFPIALGNATALEYLQMGFTNIAGTQLRSSLYVI